MRFVKNQHLGVCGPNEPLDHLAADFLGGPLAVDRIAVSDLLVVDRLDVDSKMRGGTHPRRDHRLGADDSRSQGQLPRSGERSIGLSGAGVRCIQCRSTGAQSPDQSLNRRNLVGEKSVRAVEAREREKRLSFRILCRWGGGWCCPVADLPVPGGCAGDGESLGLQAVLVAPPRTPECVGGWRGAEGANSLLGVHDAGLAPRQAVLGGHWFSS